LRHFQASFSLSPKNLLITVIFLQATLYVTVFFDLPVVRQILAFLYLTFVPGVVIVKLLKFELDNVNTVLFSVGFSVAFLMICGFLENQFHVFFGLLRPLSLAPLMITLNTLVLLGSVVVYLKGSHVDLPKAATFRLSLSTLLLLILPVLSVVGAMLVNVTGNSVILLGMIFAVSVLFVLGVASERFLPSRMYPFVIVVIAISLLFHSSLISSYPISFGSDVPLEFYVFKKTLVNAQWSEPTAYWSITYSRINAMLSITILPTIYSVFLNLDPAWVFKIVDPLLFCFVAVGLYQFCRTYVGEKKAFITTFFFMSLQTFFTEMVSLNRQMIGELFFVLLLLVVFSKELKPARKIVSFLVFSIALVTSHYALAEIFFILIAAALTLTVLTRRKSRSITAGMVMLFFVVMFCWYIYTSRASVFDTLTSYGRYVYDQLDQFLSPASRGETVLRGLGIDQSPSIWNTLSRIFAYLTELLVVIGFLRMFIRRKELSNDKEYFFFNLVGIAFLAAIILVPGLAKTFNMTRFYHVLLFVLAPLCVLGAFSVAGFLLNRRKEISAAILLVSVLTPYFLFQTGFMYEITRSESWSLPLSMYRMDWYKLYREMGYVPERNVPSACWISKYVEAERTTIYADVPSQHKELVMYGMAQHDRISVLSNTTKPKAEAIIYLGELNLMNGIVVGTYTTWNTSELSNLFGQMDTVYCNGGSEIYKNVISTSNN